METTLVTEIRPLIDAWWAHDTCNHRLQHLATTDCQKVAKPLKKKSPPNRGVGNLGFFFFFPGEQGGGGGLRNRQNSPVNETTLFCCFDY